MKTEELRKKDKSELKKLALELKKKLSDIRFKFSASQLKNVKERGNVKREIARVMTIIRENKNIKT